MGVADGPSSSRLIVGTSLPPGLAGKVENGPSVTERLLGGLPRSFPEPEDALLPVHADETPRPCRRLGLDLFGVIADCDPSFHICVLVEGVMAERG